MRLKQKSKISEFWKTFFYLTLHVCVFPEYAYHMCAGANRGQKRASDLELELPYVHKLPMWVRGIELESSTRAITAEPSLYSPHSRIVSNI